MSPDPYRRAPSTLDTDPLDPNAQRAAAFEERGLATVLLVAGLVGLIVGLSSPRSNATELVLGAVLVWVGSRTFAFRRARCEQVRPVQR